MKILVSGGTGLVGRSLVRELAAAGHPCTVLSRNPEVHRQPAESIRIQQWNATAIEPLAELMEESDAVVHLAGESIGAGRWTAARKQSILESRVVSTRALAAAVAQSQSPPGVFVQASAVGYYGPCGDEVVTEDSEPGTDFLAEVCREWESASSEVEASGVRRVLARTGIVLSAAGGALPKMAQPFKLFAGGPAGSGSQWMPWIHLADEVGALQFLLEQPQASGAFNLTAPNPVTNREFSATLGRALKRPSLVPAPAFALRLALGEMADLILTGQRAVPERLLKLGYRFQFERLETALADIY